MSKERLEEIAQQCVLVNELEEEESDEQSGSVLTYDSEDVSVLAHSQEDNNKGHENDTVSDKGQFKTGEDFIKEAALMRV